MPPSLIAVVGPVLPYRGGIAQYNSLLVRALARSDIDARFFSFSRQYPQWLYPGASDRDPTLSNYAEPGVRYTIDSLNPLTWWKTVREITELDPTLVVFHWWTAFWAPCFMTMIQLLKRRGFRVALIGHNLADHDAGGLKAAISRRVLDMADAYLVHSSEHMGILQRERPDKPVVFHPIPVYGHYPPAQHTLAKRGRLELLFFGFIRPYKGLDILLEAIRTLADKDVYLTVVGEHWGDSQAIVEETADSPNIELHLRYISDAETAEYFDRADFVVLPYTAATPSAVASVAFHYDTPIIASHVKGLTDVVIAEETGILAPPGDSGALAQIISSLDRTRSQQLAQGVVRYKQAHDWNSLCASLHKLTEIK